MNRIWMGTLVVASLLLAAACAGSGPQAGTPPATAASADTDKVAQVIDGLERDWARAIVAKDAAAIERLLADDFTGTSQEVVYSKADAIGDVRGDTTYESLDLTNIKVRVLGDTAVATMDQTEKGTHAGEPFSGHYLFTNVWVKRNGQWQVVASHGSRGR